MLPIQIDFDVANVDPDGLADGVASSGTYIITSGQLVSGHDTDGIVDGGDSSGTSLTFNGLLINYLGIYSSADDEPHRIYILDTATADQSGATFTVIGTDKDGNALSEAVTGPGSGAAVVTSGLFKTVSAITIGSGVACGTVDVGPLGVYVAADGFGHQIDIIDTATTDQSGAVFTITGEDADGYTQTEAVTGPTSGATVESAKYFKKVHKIDITDGAACGTVDIGTVDEVASKTYVIDSSQTEPAAAQVMLTGTANFDIEVTLKDPFVRDNPAPFAVSDQEDFDWINSANFGGISASKIATLGLAGIRAFRIVTNSYTDGAELQVYMTFPRR